MTGTYIGLRLTEDSTEELQSFAESLGLQGLLPSEKYHLTLIYSKDKTLDYVPRPERRFKSTVVSADIIGEGKWRALVLKLRSPDAHRRFNAITKVYGNVHSYPDFLPHISLKYGPKPKDLHLLKKNLPKDMVLTLTGEYTEAL